MSTSQTLTHCSIIQGHAASPSQEPFDVRRSLFESPSRPSVLDRGSPWRLPSQASPQRLPAGSRTPTGARWRRETSAAVRRISTTAIRPLSQEEERRATEKVSRMIKKAAKAALPAAVDATTAIATWGGEGC
jgi:hypothetical protein